MKQPRIVIVGMGIAGTSLAYFLSRNYRGEIVVIDAERIAGFHSSGRSNGNFIHLFEPDAAAKLSVASAPFLYDPPAAFSASPLVTRRGAIVCVAAGDLARHDREIREARRLGIAVEEIDAVQVARLVPILNTDNVKAAAYYPDSGPIDTNELISLYIRHAKASGVRFLFNRSFEAAKIKNGRIAGIITNDGILECDIVVNAAGAWAGEIGRKSQAAPIEFFARRRHLISVRLPAQYDGAHWPFVRCNSIPLYFKGENGRVVASPMDEELISPQDCLTDDLIVAGTADALNTHTTLRVRHIENAWAGIRTFTADRMPVVGFDSRLRGFFWLAGQGGTGIQSSPFLGQLAAKALVEGSIPHGEKYLAPERFLASDTADAQSTKQMAPAKPSARGFIEVEDESEDADKTGRHQS